MKSLYRCVAGLDVHRMLYVLTVLIEQADGSLSKEQRQFSGFQRDVRALVAWLKSLNVELVVLESTGIYWKSIYAALEAAGIPAHVVNARHVKNVPGRKTDVADSEWLAQLGRFGLVRPSFIPPKDLRELRLVSRYRQKLSQMQASEKNRLHKILDDAGIKLGAVVADIDAFPPAPWSRASLPASPSNSLPSWKTKLEARRAKSGMFSMPPRRPRAGRVPEGRGALSASVGDLQGIPNRPSSHLRANPSDGFNVTWMSRAGTAGAPKAITVPQVRPCGVGNAVRHSTSWDTLLDSDLAGESRAKGCPHCGGALHQAHYPRKPRGIPSDHREAFVVRFSFCCAGCRRRVTSPSLRFLGRKVYVGLVVVLASCCEGRIASWFAKVSAATGVSLRTLYRWRSFWRDRFPATPFWREAAARFMPPPEVARFPASLLERFGILPPADQALLAFLRFLAPLSVGPVIRFGEG